MRNFLVVLLLTCASLASASSWRGTVVVTDGGVANNLPTDGGAFSLTAGSFLLIQPTNAAYVCVDELDPATSVPTCLHGTKVAADESFSTSCNSGRRAAVLDDGSTSPSCVVSCTPVSGSTVSCPVTIRNNNEVMRTNGVTTTQLSTTLSQALRLVRTRWSDCAATVWADGGTTAKIYLATRLSDGGQYGQLPCEAILDAADISSPGNERFWFDPYDQTFTRPPSFPCYLQNLDGGAASCVGHQRFKVGTADGGLGAWGIGTHNSFPIIFASPAMTTATTLGSSTTLVPAVSAVTYSSKTSLQPEFTFGWESVTVVPIPALDGGAMLLEVWE